MSERRKFTTEEKKSLYKRYGGRCAICGKPVSYDDMTVDHIVPLSQGGNNHFANLQLACLPCNRMKADCNSQQFYKKLRQVWFYHKTLQVKTLFLGRNA